MGCQAWAFREVTNHLELDASAGAGAPARHVRHNPDVPSRATFDLFTSDEFIAGLGLGLVALVIGVLTVAEWRRWRRTAVPMVGMLLTATAGAAIWQTRDAHQDLWFGIVLLAAGGAAFPWARRVPFFPAVLALPGAWWVTRIVDLPSADWVLWLMFGWIVVAAPLVSSFDRHFSDRGYGPVLLLIAVGGMLATLPDTEHILVVFGAALPLVLLAWPKAWASLGSIGVYAALGLLAWVIAVDGRGRESAVIGAVACLGLMVVEPLIRWWRKRTLLDRIPPTWWGSLVVGTMQLVVVLLAARVAGLRDAPLSAAVVAVLVLSASAVLLAVGSGPMRNPGPGSQGSDGRSSTADN